MGARNFLLAVIACSASASAGAQTPKPGSLETYKDWTIGCDNRGRCEAVSLLAEGGNWPDNPLMVGIRRDAGPDAAPEVWASRDARGPAEYSFIVDGRKVASTTGMDGEAKISGPQASALAVAMARGFSLEIRSGAKMLGRPSLAGSGAALRYMDAQQGRAGTVTALIATGPLGVNVVRRAPPSPTIKRFPVFPEPAPVAFWREELTALGSFTGCAEEMRSAQPLEQHRLAKGEELVLVPCGSGAYNFTAVPVIATGVAGRRTFRFAAFDYLPGWSEGARHPMLVNASWSPERSRLESRAKGRGIGDCGGSESYVWDGVRFRLAEATAMGECRGAWRWITTWSARVVERDR
ncbi:DUF1176 domain-containing protein [Sphingobium cloacae]|uniref:DUF1176 domain-containing protein n=1 Tax=Sphingobium cloacae TaxID=120107 RepID=A0A1E1F718_9SPHN|nr:DUF1176 domain-containing protein [Sphingobium cloacae]BAV66304.1 hypothetical protein SCLO_1032640 [Sphingobium cloacae]